MYKYENEKPKIFTEEGQRYFLQIRDNIHILLNKSGAFEMSYAILNASICGDLWFMIACIDRMVELGEIKEVKRDKYTPGQYRIFVKSNE